MQERGGQNPFPDKKFATATYDDVMAHIRDTQKFAEKLSVNQDEATWMPYGEYPQLPIAITWMSDIHFGNIEVDYDAFNAHINAIASTPNMFVVFGGDMIDNFNPTKYPDGMMHDAVFSDTQAKAFVELMEVLDRQSKLGALVWGNHEDFSKVSGISLFSTFFSDVSCPIFSDGGGVLNVVLEGAKYRLGVRHTFWGNSKLNITNAPKRMMQFGYPDLDVAMVGHVHTAGGEMFTNAGKEQIAITGGTYKTRDSFRKRWIGDPHLGGLTITLDPMEKKMGLYRSPLDAQKVIMANIQQAMDEGYRDPYTELREQLAKRDDITQNTP